MASPLVSILLPHLRTPENNKALAVALDCLATNTGIDYELIIEGVEERRDIYPVVNRMVKDARCEWIVKTNSDVFFAPGWLEPMWEAREQNTIVAGVLVEPGAIGVSVQNIHLDFGMRPETFRRADFERFARETRLFPDGRGWIWPSLHNRQTFLDICGYDSTHIQWPEPVDLDYWQRWEAAGKQFKRVRSYAYHLQNFSNDDEQKKPVRQGR